MSRVPYAASKSIAKSGKQIRTLFSLPPSLKLAEPPVVARPASPTAPSRAVPHQNNHSGQNPPPSSSSLHASQNTSPAMLFAPLPVPGSSMHISPLWMFASPSHQQTPSNYRLSSAGHGIPKPRHAALPEEDKALTLAVQVGEDAYFVTQNGLGVADGVGGWSSSKHAHNIPGQRSNSSLFSRRLMHFCSQELQRCTGEPDPVQILQSAYNITVGLSMAEGIMGSSTALLAVLSRDGHELRVAHVGDCCLFLIRNREIIYRSEEMQHRFNYPLQLGPLSPTTPQQHAQAITLPVQEQDVIILSTDGMSDNLWDEDVIDQLSKLAGPSLESNYQVPPDAESAGGSPSISATLRTALLPTTLSHSLCTRARTVSESGPCSWPPNALSADTPFSRRAKQEGLEYEGGKPDGVATLRGGFAYA
ncbi:SubName: Full=Uncharacterized protein {ECO:0000313/EMBL:CCA69882.1} [Serendipita indica DSM 11827]|nr:SubName: Full=Uncharacterized protein {ECO:0000313/EMBL:CCA69882.1} [Serendipita indica DSM 11827]